MKALLALILGLVINPWAFAATAAVPEQKPPNFVIILADDMGFSDAGCYGGEIQTPNLDRLAQNGLRFTQFYNTARCWPTRASILTGYYPQQVRRDALPKVAGGAGGKRPSWARLLPEMLRPLGYRSYHSGKWHVDGKVLEGGFDHSYSLNDHDRAFNPKQHTLDDKPLPPVSLDSGYYHTTEIARHAVEMLSEHERTHRDSPFFLYLAFTSPHFPLQALPEDIGVYQDRYLQGWDVLRRERYDRLTRMGMVDCDLPPLDTEVWPSWNFSPEKLSKLIGPGEVARAVPWNQLNREQRELQSVKMALHAAMIHRIDIEIGKVLEQIRAMGAWENTLILFLSDNGASAELIVRGDMHDRTASPGAAGTYLSLGPGWSSAANTPFRLHKSWVHEGGISTPFIAHWPAGISGKGEFRNSPAHVIDLAPTLLALAGGQGWPSNALPPPGKSLVPLFAKDGTMNHDCLWWLHDGNRAIRIGDWKLVSDHKKAWELYYLGHDRAETKNLADENPGKVKELSQAWNKLTEQFEALARTRE